MANRIKRTKGRIATSNHSWLIFRLRGAYALFRLAEIRAIDSVIADVIRSKIDDMIAKAGAKRESERESK